MDGVIGRERELAHVEAFVNDLRDDPAALVIHGDAGIGKTTLWRAAVVETRRRSHRVLVCRASETESALPFLGLADIFDDCADTVAALAEPQRRALEAALGRAEAIADRVAVARATVSVLRSLAAEAPTVVAIDDAQWLDAPSADALRFAARRLEALPVGFVVSVRGEAERVPLELDRALAPGRLLRLRVEPLPPRDLQALIASRVPIRLGRPRSKALHRISGGNPLFALQIAEAAAAQGLAPAGDVPVPATVAGAVAARLANLSDRTRDALLAAAALAQPTLDVVRREELAEAVAGGIVELDANRIRFSHPLFSSVVYALAPAERQRHVHRQLAAVVADPEERALHLARGADVADEAVARELEEAAERASKLGHSDAAAELAAHAERLTPDAQGDDRARRAMAAAVYLYAAGDGRRSADLLARAIERLSAGPVRARALRLLGWVEDDVKASAAHLRQALAEAGDDARLLSEIHQQLARTEVFGGDWAAGARHAKAAVAHAERAGHAGVLATALARLAMTPALRGKRMRLDALDRAVALERTLPEPLRLSESPLLFRGVVLLSADRLVDARAAFDDAYQRGLALGDMWRGIVLTFMAELECRAGNWERALAHALEAEDLATQWAVADGESWGLYARGLVEAHLGNVDVARERLERAAALARGIHNAWVDLRVQSALAFLALSTDDRVAALAHFDVLLAPPPPVRALPDLVEALVGLGDVDRAAAVSAKLAERAAATGLPSVVAGGARSSALVAAARGDLAAAEAAAREALAAHARLDEPFERARTLLVLGAIERRAKRKREAREVLAQAEATLESLGARLWQDKVHAELERTGLRHATDALTPTEQRVAELAARGATNKEIGSALFMSVKTVEANLSRVYGKLSVRSRTELANRLVHSS
jgi:DNA-binding NarL/FixJ family response regulator